MNYYQATEQQQSGGGGNNSDDGHVHTTTKSHNGETVKTVNGRGGAEINVSSTGAAVSEPENDDLDDFFASLE